MGWFRALTRTAAGLGVILIAAPEAAHLLSSRLEHGDPRTSPDATEAMIVLGCPTNPDGSLEPEQRWRVDIAARTMNPRVKVVVFTGTTAKTGVSEASAMAAYARTRGIPDDVIVLEEEALSTWQNLQYSAPLVEGHDVLRLVSNPMHAWRARQFLTRQNPQLAVKLAPAHDYRPVEAWYRKLHTMIYEIVARYREWRNPRLTPGSTARGRPSTPPHHAPQRPGTGRPTPAPGCGSRRR